MILYPISAHNALFNYAPNRRSRWHAEGALGSYRCIVEGESASRSHRASVRNWPHKIKVVTQKRANRLEPVFVASHTYLDGITRPHLTVVRLSATPSTSVHLPDQHQYQIEVRTFTIAPANRTQRYLMQVKRDRPTSASARPVGNEHCQRRKGDIIRYIQPPRADTKYPKRYGRAGLRHARGSVALLPRTAACEHKYFVCIDEFYRSANRDRATVPPTLAQVTRVGFAWPCITKQKLTVQRIGKNAVVNYEGISRNFLFQPLY